VRALRTADAASARHHASQLARQAAVLQIRIAKTLRNNCFQKYFAPHLSGAYFLL
jgi:hypothetical protein